MKITASIVTYNSGDEIVNILSCLEKCLKIGLNEVYIIDNNSVDDTCLIIKEKYPWVKLFESTKNLGFGAGHNLAIHDIESDIHLIINPDITINENQFKDIIDYMINHDEIVLLCPKVLNSDGTIQFLPKRNPRLKYLLGSIGLFKKYRSEYTMQNVQINEPIEIEFCTGCFMVCKTNALKASNGFDNRYFLYFEDADLSRTLKQYGRIIYNPDLYVTHTWKRENRKTLKGIKVFLSSYAKYRKKWRKNKDEQNKKEWS